MRIARSVLFGNSLAHDVTPNGLSRYLAEATKLKLKPNESPMRPLLFLLTMFISYSAISAADFDGTKSAWHGFDRYDFQVDGRKCWAVVPKSVAEGCPWVWRARFFGHEPQADIALLNEGYHLAYCDVGGLFGSPKAVAHWDAFYKVMTEEHGLSKQPALEGMSRGGLIIYNWAIANPNKVSCIYGDAPVCDFKSWPGGKGKGKASAGAWQQCLKAYGLTEAEALEYKHNPIDGLASLAKSKVPLLQVVGDADTVVPVAENTAIIEARYKKLGGSIKVIHKPGIGHHPHALKDPGPIVAFIRQHTESNVRLRDGISNARIRFLREKKGHVAFIGGSITKMNGYRPMVCEGLQKRFPETDFKFTAAGISSTCSTTGAFRLKRDVLSHGPVDLFFVEYAVNDDQDAGHARRECIRGMEGIVRQVRKHNPNADIVITHFVNPGMLKQLQSGKTPLSMRAHSDVAEHYGVPTIHLGKELAEQISAGESTWQQYGGTHPKPFGNRICANMIEQLMDAAWAKPLANDDEVVAHAEPTSRLDSLSYENGRFQDLETVTLGAGWKIEVPNWKEIRGRKRSRYTSLPMLCSEVSGAALSVEFSGTAIGAFVVAGPDAGILEAQVDGGEVRAVNLYHRFSKGLHYPRTVMFATDLKPGKHILKLRVSKETKGKGTAARIMKFAVN